MLVYGCISGFQPDEVTPITFTPGAARGCDGLGFQPFPLQNCKNISLFFHVFLSAVPGHQIRYFKTLTYCYY